jgi:hypothetical protein
MTNEGLHNMYTSSSIIWEIKSRRMRWTGACSTHGKDETILVGESGVKRPLGRSRRIWKDTIRTNLMEIEWEGVDWIHLAQYKNRWRALVNEVMNLRVP